MPRTVARQRFAVSIGSVIMLLVAPSASALADVDFLTGSGYYGGLAPTTLEVAPDSSWSFTVDVESRLGDDLSATFWDFQFLLNGAPVVDAPTRILFLPQGDSGLFEIDFLSGDTVSLFGDQAYDPGMNLVHGFYPAIMFVTNDDAGQGTNAEVAILPAGTSSVPEPSSIALAVLLGAVASLRTWSRRRQVSSRS